ncbi:MAG: TPM domain-containing protein [Myxococcota bacterium]
MLLVSLALAALPVLVDPVTDQAGVLGADEVGSLDAGIRDIRARTGVQIAVLTVPTVGEDHTIESYALGVAEAWGGGRSGADDGVLVVLAVTDRRSRIEVGYGLEGLITDAEAGLLLDGAAPSLREGAYGEALQGVVSGIGMEVGSLVAGERTLPMRARRALGPLLPSGPWSTGVFFTCAFMGGTLTLLAWRRGEPRVLTARLPDALWVGAVWALAVVVLLGLHVGLLGDVLVLRCLQLVGGFLLGAPLGFAAGPVRFWVCTLLTVVLMGLALWWDLELAASGAEGMPWMMLVLIWPWLSFMGAMDLGDGDGGDSDSGSGGSYGWSSSSSDSSSSSSSGSSGGDWGGGGGGFGGGGASGSW